MSNAWTQFRAVRVSSIRRCRYHVRARNGCHCAASSAFSAHPILPSKSWAVYLHDIRKAAQYLMAQLNFGCEYQFNADDHQIPGAPSLLTQFTLICYLNGGPTLFTATAILCTTAVYPNSRGAANLRRMRAQGRKVASISESYATFDKRKMTVQFFYLLAVHCIAPSVKRRLFALAI